MKKRLVFTALLFSLSFLAMPSKSQTCEKEVTAWTDENGVPHCNTWKWEHSCFVPCDSGPSTLGGAI